MLHFKKVLLIALMGFALSGCASLITGNKQAVEIASSPQGARVFIEGTYRGETPLVILIVRSYREKILLQKEGYRDQHFTLHSGFNPASSLNFMALPGILIDIFGGAVFEYDKDRYIVRMIEQSPIKVQAHH